MNTTRATTKKHPASDTRAMQDNLGDVGNSIANLASDQYERAHDAAGDAIRRNPFAAVAIGFGLGFWRD
ncbi:MAG: hypothetical protein JJE37_02210 [Methyloceanibacter sp.]|jgi:ElaB/YqjD/DUF883 family membrane-anchored ribosome-binding protein|nr:hypothetical protein [Methyloceanibacter sp.]